MFWLYVPHNLFIGTIEGTRNRSRLGAEMTAEDFYDPPVWREKIARSCGD